MLAHSARLPHAAGVNEIAERRVRAALRALAAVGFTCGIALAVFAWSVGDGTVGPAMIVIVMPAVLVWFRPTPRTVGVWAGFAWFSALMLLLTFNPLGNNEALADYVDVLLPAMLAALPVAAYGASAYTVERSNAEPSSLERKLRSIAAVTFGLGLTIAVIGFLPGQSLDYGMRVNSAGGMPLVVLLAVMISPGLPAYAAPNRAHGWRWSLLALGLGVPGSALLTFSLGLESMSHEPVTLWPRRVVELGLGTILVLLLVVMPLVLLFTRGDDEPPATTLPSARLR